MYCFSTFDLNTIDCQTNKNMDGWEHIHQPTNQSTQAIKQENVTPAIVVFSWAQATAMRKGKKYLKVK